MTLEWQWGQRVIALMQQYRAGSDPEVAHGEEDEMLEEFVRLRAGQGDAIALCLVPLLDLDRKRWYA